MLLRTVTVLKILLAEDGRPQLAISKLAGIDNTTLSKIVTGERRPTEDQVRRLAKVLQVHPSVLTAEITRDDLVGIVEQRTEPLRSIPATRHPAGEGPEATPPILGEIAAGKAREQEGVIPHTEPPRKSRGKPKPKK